MKLFLSFCFLAVPGWHLFAQNAEKLYKKAEKNYHHHQHELALVQLDQVISVDSQHYKAYELKAKVYGKLKQEDSLTKYLYLYAHAFQRDYQVWQALAVRFFSANNFGKAEECADRALQMSPNATLFNYRGVIQMQKKEYDQALGSFRKAYDLDSSRESIIYNVGYAYVMLDSLSQAEKHFIIALKLNHRFSLPYLGMAIVSYLNKNYSKTLQFSNMALATSSPAESKCEALYYRALALKESGEVSKACFDHFKIKSLRCDPAYDKPFRGLCGSEQKE